MNATASNALSQQTCIRVIICGADSRASSQARRATQTNRPAFEYFLLQGRGDNASSNCNALVDWRCSATPFFTCEFFAISSSAANVKR